MRNQKGFTILELMIAVAILGVLMAIAVPNFIGYRNRSFCTTAEADANSVAAALADYFSVPTRTVVPEVQNVNTYLSVRATGQNLITVEEDDDTRQIIITLTEGHRRCPADYRNAMNQERNPAAYWNQWNYIKIVGLPGN